MRTNSWIITKKETGELIGEFYNWALVERFNPAKVLVETAYEYLTRINKQIKERPIK